MVEATCRLPLPTRVYIELIKSRVVLLPSAEARIRVLHKLANEETEWVHLG